jgi:hypothetical protein
MAKARELLHPIAYLPEIFERPDDPSVANGIRGALPQSIFQFCTAPAGTHDAITVG